MSQFPDLVNTPHYPSVGGSLTGGDFDRLSLYDAPSVALAQILEGEASFRSIWRTFLTPNKLSPEQRTRLEDSLLEGRTGDPITRTLVGIATNPFVWLGLLTTPGAAKAIKKGLDISQVAKQASPFMQQHAGLLNMLGLTSSFQVVRGTAMEAAARQGNRHVDNLLKEVMTPVAEAEAKVLSRLEQSTGLKFRKGLSFEAYEEGSQQRRVLEDVNNAMAVHFDKLDEVVTTKRMAFETDESGKILIRNGRPILKSTDITRGRIVSEEAGEQARRILRDTGADELVKEMARSRKNLFVKLVGDEEAWEGGEFVLDRLKATKLLGAFKNPTLNGVRPAHIHTRSVIEQALGSDFIRALDQGDITDDAFFDTLQQVMFGREGREAVGEILEDRFMPRNLVQPIERLSRDGEVLPPLRESINEASRDRVVFGSPSRIAPRQGKGDVYSLAALSRLQRTFGPSKELTEATERATKVARRAGGGSRGGRPRSSMAYDINPTRSFERYVSEAARQHTQYVMELDDDVIRRISADVDNIDPDLLNTGAYSRVLKQGTTRHVAIVDGERIRSPEDWERAYKKATSALREKKTKANYQKVRRLERLIPHRYARSMRESMNVAMLADFTYDNLPSEWHRHTLKKVIVPGITNQMPIREVAQIGAHLSAKEAMRRFSDSPLAAQIEKGGGAAERAISRMREFANRSDDLVIEGGVSGAVAKHLYVTHLGINAGSVILNMTQPFLLASVGLPFRSVARGYVKAFSEMAEYAQDRAKMGLRAISPLEREKLMRKHHPLFDQAGLAVSAKEAADQVTYGSGVFRQNQKDEFFETLMKPFEYSERFNRLVTAHAVADVARSGRGGIRSGASVANAVDFFVKETQFGSEILNTPTAFLTNPFFSNPLVRQFMTFPLRSFTGAVYTFPRLGGEESYVRGLANTMARGMATSAVLYEGAKGLLEADISRGLFFESTTDFFGGERLLEANGEVIQLPPIASIPVDFIRGIAGGDVTLMGDSLSRLVPGGVALRRVTNVFPMGEDERPVLAPLQTRAVDYDNPLPSGEVPVFDNRGFLVGYEKPSEMILRGLGLDLGRTREQGDLDQYLLKIREVTVEERRKMLQALLSNDVPRATRIQKRFQREYGVPLTVTQAQLKAFADSRTKTRTERIFDRTPSEVKPMLQSLVAPEAENLMPDAFNQGPSQRQRLNQQQVEMIQRQIREMVGPAASQPTFTPFESF